jgi:hypothetical protein
VGEESIGLTFPLLVEQRDDCLNRPDVITDTSLHRRSYPEALMHLGEVVVHEAERHGVRVHLFFLAKSGSEARVNPDVHPLRQVLPLTGSVLATALWIFSSFAFRVYVTNFGDYTVTYGAIGGAIVTTLWFYVSSIAILIGAELNGVIEDAWRSVDA